MKKYFAELIGTAILVLAGCGTAIFAGDNVGQLGIALAFGFGLTIAAFGFGSVSGAHVNPAVSLGMLVAGRLSVKDFVGYAVFQFAGAAIAAGLLFLIAEGKVGGYDIDYAGFAQNGFGEAYNGGFGLCSAVLFELVATFVFVRFVLEVSKKDCCCVPLAIGIALAAVHLIGIQIDGVSVNPARSFGPALFAGAEALGQLWVFIAVPLAAGLLAGIAYRAVDWSNASTGEKKAAGKKK